MLSTLHHLIQTFIIKGKRQPLTVYICPCYIERLKYEILNPHSTCEADLSKLYKVYKVIQNDVNISNVWFCMVLYGFVWFCMVLYASYHFLPTCSLLLKKCQKQFCENVAKLGLTLQRLRNVENVAKCVMFLTDICFFLPNHTTSKSNELNRPFRCTCNF